MIIALTGYAGSGKDAVGEILVKECGFTRLAFADKLKECMSVLNPIVKVKVRKTESGFCHDKIRLNDSNKLNPEVRRLYQVFGTEVGRQLLGNNIWVDILMKQIDPLKDYVVTDLRFPNEYHALNGKSEFWRIDRPNRQALAADSHESESYVQRFVIDHVIVNDGTLEDLKQKVLQCLTK